MRHISQAGFVRSRIAAHYAHEDFKREAEKVDAEQALADRIAEKNAYAEYERAVDQAAFEAKLDAETKLNEPVKKPQPSLLLNLQLIFAGDAIFTIVNNETGNRFTYSVVKSKPTPQYMNQVWFVRVLTGPQNTSDYSYIGFVRTDMKYLHGKAKSRISEDAQSVQVFKWLMQRIEHAKPLPPQVQVWHSGHCCKCGRLLTVDESIKRGLGPECAGKI